MAIRTRGAYEWLCIASILVAIIHSFAKSWRPTGKVSNTIEFPEIDTTVVNGIITVHRTKTRTTTAHPERPQNKRYQTLIA